MVLISENPLLDLMKDFKTSCGMLIPQAEQQSV
jgi:hypothetical protein